MRTGRTVALCAIALIVAALATASDSAASPRSDACAVFGSRCAKAWAVALCESRGDPRAVGRAGERGLFQIHPVHFGWAKPWLLFVPRYNAQAAYRISHGGTNWQAWGRCG